MLAPLALALAGMRERNRLTNSSAESPVESPPIALLLAARYRPGVAPPPPPPPPPRLPGRESPGGPLPAACAPMLGLEGATRKWMAKVGCARGAPEGELGDRALGLGLGEGLAAALGPSDASSTSGGIAPPP